MLTTISHFYEYSTKAFIAILLQNKEEEVPKKWNWRQKHEYCLASIRAARGDTYSGPTTSEITASTQQQCDYCKRRFNDDAIKRHLPICAKLHHKKFLNY